jgi:aminoglycoside 3-N-acetyltransferase I
MTSNNLQYSRLGPEDGSKLIELIKLFKEVFEMDQRLLPSPDYLTKLLRDSNKIFLVASYSSRVVGGLSGYLLESVHGYSEIYVYDLAVHTNFQRQGIGQSLMREIKNLAEFAGASQVFVQADVVDQQALEFYRKIGGVETDVRHFTFSV